jgi:hypothetical protein
MTSQILASTVQSSHSLQSVQSHIERLFQEIEVLIKQKKEVENVKKYTVEINKKSSKIDEQIETRKLSIEQCQTMLGLPPGSWVRNGTTKPGKVIDLVISGRIPEVHVQWHGASISVPESPAKLTLVSPELVEYFWHGDRRPKLIRRIDGWECDEIAILDRRLAESIEDKSDPDRRFKLAYCKKRIALIDQEDLINLERAVKQGLAVFYRVGEALAEIRDRQLYKQHGYKDFREYLKEKWNMGKSQAYRLIDSNEVIKNLKSVHHGGQKEIDLESVPHGGQNILNLESVPHGGQKILPDSERVTRELAKLPPDQQSEAWKKAVETSKDNNPTAAHTKAVVTGIINSCPDKTFTVQIDNFEVGQLVQIKSDRSDKRLVGYHRSVGIVTQINPASVNLKIWGQIFDNVSPNDLKILDEPNFPAICISPSAEDYKKLLMNFDSREEIIKAALEARSLNNEI